MVCADNSMLESFDPQPAVNHWSMSIHTRLGLGKKDLTMILMTLAFTYHLPVNYLILIPVRALTVNLIVMIMSYTCKLHIYESF